VDFGPWLLGAATVLVAQGLTLGADAVRERSRARTAAKERVKGRADEAANRTLDLLDDARNLFEDDSPDQRTVYATCHQIDREALFFDDSVVRGTLEAASSVIWHADTPVLDGFPRSIVWLAVQDAREVLGAWLREKPVTEVPERLVAMQAEVKAAYEVIDTD
jgi:hypothetical protein